MLLRTREHAPDTPASLQEGRAVAEDNDNPSDDAAPITALEVLSVEVAAGHRARIAASFLDKSVVVWALSPTGGFTSLWQISQLTFIPKAVRYGMNKRLWVFAMTGGAM